MKYEISPDRRTLTLIADPAEVEALQSVRDEDPDFFGHECETLENLLANSELQWISPADTGDMTDAPMLGILGDESTEESGPHGAVFVGHWDGADRFQPVLERWAFMPYALRSFLAGLADDGRAVFTS